MMKCRYKKDFSGLIGGFGAKAGLEPKSPQPAVITFLLAFKRTIVGPFCSRGYILSLIR